MRKVLVLFSGGIDSTVLLYKAITEVTEVKTVTFDYGSKHNYSEVEHASRIINNVGVEAVLFELDLNDIVKSRLMLDGDDLLEGDSSEAVRASIVPFRNGIMTALAAGHADSNGYNEVWIGSSAEDALYFDCSPNFMWHMDHAIAFGTKNKVQLRAPFNLMKKKDIIKLGKGLTVPFELTYSCYEGEGKPCGKCPACVVRAKAFAANNMEDPCVSSL